MLYMQRKQISIFECNNSGLSLKLLLFLRQIALEVEALTQKESRILMCEYSPVTICFPDLWVAHFWVCIYKSGYKIFSEKNIFGPWWRRVTDKVMWSNHVVRGIHQYLKLTFFQYYTLVKYIFSFLQILLYRLLPTTAKSRK